MLADTDCTSVWFVFNLIFLLLVRVALVWHFQRFMLLKPKRKMVSIYQFASQTEDKPLKL